MKEMILKMALPILMNIITEMMTTDNLKKYGEKLYNLLEEIVADSETTIDDVIVLPMVKAARLALGISNMGEGKGE